MKLEDRINCALTCLLIMDRARDLIAIMGDKDYIENVGDKKYYKEIYEINKNKFKELLKSIPTEELYEELNKDCYKKQKNNFLASYEVFVMENKD